jgi:hypothetical protein
VHDLGEGSRTVFIEAPEESTVGDDVAHWYQQQRDAWGYLPNYAAAFATRPDVAQAWNTLNNAVRGQMDRRRFELATIPRFGVRSLSDARSPTDRRRGS